MTENEHRMAARARAEAKFGFYVHAAVFAAVMTMLAGIDLLSSSRTIWFVWPLFGWGLGIALHAAWVFLLRGGTTAIDALTEREMRGAKTPRHDPTDVRREGSD